MHEGGGRESMNFDSFNRCLDIIRNNGGSKRKVLRNLEKAFGDREQNLRRWLRGEPCRFISDLTGERKGIRIGDDREAIYYFLLFCKRIRNGKTVSDDFRDYLSYLISRSIYGKNEDVEKEKSCDG